MAENLIFRRATTIIVASVVGLAGSIIALLTLWEFKDQNQTMAAQTTLMQSQNEQIIAQNKTMTDQTAIMQSQNEQIIAQNRLFKEQNRQQLVATNGQMVSALIGDLYESRKDEGIRPNTTWDVPKPLVFRVLSATEALIPYDSIKASDTIRIVSRERGELLRALVAMKAGFPLIPRPNLY